MSGLDTEQLSNLLKCINARVFALDQFPREKINENYFFCHNSEISSSDGLHWLGGCILINETTGERVFYYYDSLAAGICLSQVINFLNINDIDKVVVNKKPTQFSSSSLCGHYVALFLCWMYSGKSYESFLSQFSDDLESNDKKVEDFFKMMCSRKNFKFNFYAAKQDDSCKHRGWNFTRPSLCRFIFD